MKGRARLAWVGLAVAGLCAAARADEISDTFKALYGKDLRRVKATADRKDDLALAEQMLKAASAGSVTPALLGLLCRNACDLAAAAPDGEATAVAAMELLARKVPECRVGCLEKIVGVREGRYRRTRGFDQMEAGEALVAAYVRAADAKADADDFSGARLLYRKALTVAARVKSPRVKEIQGKTQLLMARERTAMDLKRLRARLKTHPEDTKARLQLIGLLVVECDRPADAAALLTDACDKDLRHRVRLAAERCNDLTWAACLDMGEWYRGLADGTPLLTGRRPSDPARLAMLRRARRYHETCLAKHPEKGLFADRARLALAKVKAALGEAADDPLASLQYVDLLKLLDVARDTVDGVCFEKDGCLMVTRQGQYNYYTRVMAPVVIQGAYTLRASFAILEKDPRPGTGFAVLLLPVGDGNVQLKLGRRAVIALKKDFPCDHRGADAPLGLPLNRKCTADVKVAPAGKNVSISLAVEGKPVLTWQGPQAACFGGGSAYALPDERCPALGMHCAEVTYYAAQLRMLSGKALPLWRSVKDKQVPEVPGKPLPASEWTDLMKLIDLQRDSLCSPQCWQRTDAGLRIVKKNMSGYVKLWAPVFPQGGYRLEASFSRQEGQAVPIILLPVGRHGVSVNIGGSYGAAGLDRVHGRGAGGNDSKTKPREFVTGRKYTVAIIVNLKGETAKINVDVDAEPYIKWQGPQEALSPPKHWPVRTCPRPGLSAYTGKYTIHSFRLMPLTDKAVRIR